MRAERNAFIVGLCWCFESFFELVVTWKAELSQDLFSFWTQVTWRSAIFCILKRRSSPRSARSVCAKRLSFSFLLTKSDIVKPTGSNDLQKRLSFSGSLTACHNYLTLQLTSLQSCQSIVLFLFFFNGESFLPNFEKNKSIFLQCLAPRSHLKI